MGSEERGEVKHTPRPWKIEGRSILGRCFTGTYCNICDKVRGGSPEQAEANARLIAAAPELLEALREVVALSDRKHDAWDKAKAAIAKTEGIRLENPKGETK